MAGRFAEFAALHVPGDPAAIGRPSVIWTAAAQAVRM